MKKLIKVGWSIYKKYEEILNYLIVGGLTTVVSFVSYWLITITVLDPNNPFQLQVATIFSWVCAVAFAYITNRIFVFKSKSKNYKKEILSFVSSRVITLLLDMGIMALMVTILEINDLIAKIVVQVVVTILNYIFSKLFVFKKKNK